MLHFQGSKIYTFVVVMPMFLIIVKMSCSTSVTLSMIYLKHINVVAVVVLLQYF